MAIIINEKTVGQTRKNAYTMSIMVYLPIYHTWNYNATLHLS